MPHHTAPSRLQKENITLNFRIKILEKALQFYGNPENYGDRGEYWTIVIDEGNTARIAIKEAANFGKEETEQKPRTSEEVERGI